MRPLIGITTRERTTPHGWQRIELLRAYVDAVTQAGGTPVLIPSALGEQDRAGLLARLDGILFSGGGDIAVRHFGGQPHAKVDLVEEGRDALELDLLRAAIATGKPWLGICRGCQVANVALGGTLYTHIPDQFSRRPKHNHTDAQRRLLAHTVRIVPGTRLHSILGETELQVNSLHHQGLRDLAPGLTAGAHAADGLVEAVELADHPFALAVQWHPEWLTDQPAIRRLFAAFTKAATQPSR